MTIDEFKSVLLGGWKGKLAVMILQLHRDRYFGILRQENVAANMSCYRVIRLFCSSNKFRQTSFACSVLKTIAVLQFDAEIVKLCGGCASIQRRKHCTPSNWLGGASRTSK